MTNKNFIEELADKLNKRTNPTDLKSNIIGKVVQLNPIIVQIADGRILLREGDELELSEWFRFRCEIDSTSVLSGNVSSDCQSARSISETHSYTGSACIMPDAISHLANAILGVRDELLKLKCILELDDYVNIASLETDGKYILLDKVL